MFDLIKDFLLFAYKATERIEDKSRQFAEEREKRMEEFRKERGEAKERMKQKFEEMVTQTGLATSKEVEDIKKRLADINKKLERISK